jgi:hypothetical protein
VTPSRREAGWAWAAHLRGGGTTPWLEWLASYGDERAGAAATRAGTAGTGPVPGAAQLELVRRLARRHPAPADDASFAELADVALTRSGPGRGPARIPLLWPGEDPPRHGPPSVDPARIGAEELLRVGVGLLAELLIRHPETPASQLSPTPGRRRPWRPAFRLVGAPVTVAELRAGLGAVGLVEGGRRPTVLVVAEPLDVLLSQVWSRRVQHGDSVRWGTLVSRWVRRDRLPPAAELGTIARAWAERVGPERVQIVTGPDVRREVAALLGADPALPPVPAPVPVRRLSPAGTEVLRRLNRVLGVRVDDAHRRRLRERATALLPDAADDALSVPERYRDWLATRASAVTHELDAGGYAVRGGLARIAPGHAGATHPRRADVLTTVLDSCLRAAGHTR